MQITETDYQFIFTSRDGSGKFEFRIHKDCSQIQLEMGMDGVLTGEAFVDINRKELTEIRDMINKILD